MGIEDRLRFFRTTQKMTQRELASRSRLAPEQVNRYEKGRVRPTIASTVRLARALGVSLADLLGD